MKMKEGLTWAACMVMLLAAFLMRDVKADEATPVYSYWAVYNGSIWHCISEQKDKDEVCVKMPAERIADLLQKERAARDLKDEFSMEDNPVYRSY